MALTDDRLDKFISEQGIVVEFPDTDNDKINALLDFAEIVLDDCIEAESRVAEFLNDIDEAAAIMLSRAEARIAELEHSAIDADHDREDMARQLDKRSKRIADLERVLRMVEFVDGVGDLNKCPWCFNQTYDHEHFPDCPRQKALGEKG